MRPRPDTLVNTPEIEIWPAHVVRARSNAVARVLSQATHVLRRKRDGRFLAASTAHGLVPLLAGWRTQPGMRDALRALASIDTHHAGDPHLPLARIAHRLHALGLDAAGYSERTGLGMVAEPVFLTLADMDRYARALWLHRDAARAWRRLRDAARRDGIVLEPISGYRSHDYQLGIFERKLARGQSVDDILAVNAAPGYSEHHAGRALDISAPGEPPAEESFESTTAFDWLARNAGDFGFVMSYPRGNPHGIVYEPWHWCYRP